MNDELEDLYQKYWSVHNEMLEQGHDPMAIAGVLVAHALIMYKTVLPRDEFEQMVDSISESRDKVHTLNNSIGLQ